MIKKSAILFLPLLLLPLLAMAESENAADWHKTELFSSCYRVEKVSETKLEQVKALISDPPCFRQPFIKTLKEYLVISFFPAYYRNPLRECYYCQKIITGSAQMYNYEHKPQIRRINNWMLTKKQSPLIPEYLKHPFPKAEKECRFESLGDLTASAGLFIYCTYHGSVQKIEELEKFKED